MNSYPIELLAQLAPVMFVAGLNPPTTPTPPPAAPASPPMSPTSPSTPRAQDQFASLIARLRTTLSALHQMSVWQSEKAKTFQVVLVDKDVRFPPRKLHPPEDHPDQTPRSPLSPLTPSSPLYPDGLVAPVWIRKHTSFVPSVFVLFLYLFEFPPHAPRSPLDLPDPDRERQREAEERRQDTELAAEIAQRKKATNERSIKLTVVLLASRRMLDDASLDARLTYIRRQSGLDSRAALFVLSPVSQLELNEFVQSLQQALYEPAVDYYTSHSKRVRRKRNRHAHGGSISYPTPPVSSVPVPRPLRPEGWTVRYEYKMACFAEFRGEDEVALKHYQDAYSALLLMFGSITTLPPRTKRWAEAKVLADCIDIKICKLYLYNNEHSLALSFHNTHIRKFCDFSRVWGVGEDTFEFWSWMARQQRVMAELLEHGMRSTLVLPIHRPSLLETPITMPSQQSDALTSLGLNPAHALQHPAFYYYMTARYTEKRREMFVAALALEARGAGSKLSPGFANEKKVDHSALVVEMYTRSYELFKQRVPSSTSQHNQGRLILYIALLIAQTYYESERFDMAIKFFERIAKTYRKEQWDVVLRPLLSIWYSCAQQTGNMELSVQLLLEMLGHGESQDWPGLGIDDFEDLEGALYGVLNSTVPSNQDPLVVELLNFQSIFKTSVHFWESDIYVGQPTAFQLSISMPGNIALSSLSFISVSIYFSDDASTPLVIHHSDDAPDFDQKVRRVALGDVSQYLFDIDGPVGGVEECPRAYLRWGPGVSIVFMGTLQLEVPGMLKLTKVVLTVKHNSWWIELPIELSDLRNYGDRTLETQKWLTSVDPPRYLPVKRGGCTTATVRSRPHQLRVLISHSGPAYLDEEYPITIEITNVDDKELDVTFDVMLHPPEDDSSVNRITLEDEGSMSLIRGVKFGVLKPGVNTVKTLYLLNTGAVGDRTLDVSIRSQATTQLPSYSVPRTPDSAGPHDTNETLQTLIIPATQAIKITSNVAYQRSLQPQAGLADLKTYGNDLWEDGVFGEATITSTFQCAASCGLRLESIRLECQDHATARLINCSADTIEPEDIADDWLTGDEFTTVCRVTMSQPGDSTSSIPAPGTYVVRWRRSLPNGEPGPLSTTRFSLPPLRPPTDDLVALLDLPSSGKLHVPIIMKLTTRNNHPSRTAVVTIHLEPDASDGFVVAGLRSGRVPMLLPETEATLCWKLIPIECGFVKVPKLKVIDRRKAIVPPGQEPPVPPPEPGSDGEGDMVKLVDVRWDGRSESGDEAHAAGDIGSVLIVP